MLVIVIHALVIVGSKLQVGNDKKHGRIDFESVGIGSCEYGEDW